MTFLLKTKVLNSKDEDEVEKSIDVAMITKAIINIRHIYTRRVILRQPSCCSDWINV